MIHSMFGEFIAEKRKEKGILLRSMAEELKISNPYFSDIERGRRNPPDRNMLEKISQLLALTQEDKEIMFDLAGKERHEVSPDLPEYIMDKPIVRAALRKAKNNATDEDWLKFMQSIEKR